MDSLPQLPTRRCSEESSVTRQPAPTKPHSISLWSVGFLLSLHPLYQVSRSSRNRKALRIPRNIVVTPGRAFGISGLVPRALPCPRLRIIEPGVGEPVRQITFSFLDGVDDVAMMGAAPAGDCGAGRGKDQLLAAVALEGNVRRMPLVDLAERDFVGLITRFDSFDDMRHRPVPSCRPAHPKWKGYERQRNVFVTLMTIPHTRRTIVTDGRQAGRHGRNSGCGESPCPWSGRPATCRSSHTSQVA